MYILIAGGGIVGKTITKALSKKHDVVVIEKDYEACEKISSKYGAVAIQGDATNIATLREAGIEKCDYALGVMGQDASNLVFAILCKNHDVENIFVRMRDPDYAPAYRLAGATNIAHPVRMISDKFILDIENPDIRQVASLSNGKAEISIIKVKPKAKAAGKSVSEIVNMKGFPKDLVIGGIFDLELQELIIPRGNVKVNAENQVFLVGSNAVIKEAYKFFV